MSNRRMGALDDRQQVDDEVTPARAARVRRLKRRLSWQRRLAAVVPAAVLSTLVAVGVLVVAIQALHRQLGELRAEVDQLHQQLADRSPRH